MTSRGGDPFILDTLTPTLFNQGEPYERKRNRLAQGVFG